MGFPKICQNRIKYIGTIHSRALWALEQSESEAAEKKYVQSELIQKKKSIYQELAENDTPPVVNQQK